MKAGESAIWPWLVCQYKKICSWAFRLPWVNSIFPFVSVARFLIPWLQLDQFLYCAYSSHSVQFQFIKLEMVVLKVLREFAGGTSIHGFTFLVRPESSTMTKVIWAISLVVALIYASSEMRNSVISKCHYIFRIIKQKPMTIIDYVQIQLLNLNGFF